MWEVLNKITQDWGYSLRLTYLGYLYNIMSVRVLSWVASPCPFLLLGDTYIPFQFAVLKKMGRRPLSACVCTLVTSVFTYS